MMNASLFTAYGGPEVLQYGQVEKPQPLKDQILVKIKNTTVFMGDCEIRRLEIPLGLGFFFRIGFGLFKPKFPTILGQEFAGTVESCGQDVTKFKQGDHVFGTMFMPFGTYAEFACVKTDTVMIKPDFISFSDAAALPIGATESIHFLDLANIQKGQKVMIIGAGGSIGTYAVQYAKHLGAVVTGVDHPSKQDLLKEIGCDYTVDYTRQNISEMSEKFDIVYDGAAKSTTATMKACLEPNGKIIIGTPTWGQLLQSKFDSTLLISFGNSQIIRLIKALDMVKNKVWKPIIDPKRFKLDEMDKAHEYAESGMKRGSIVIDVA